MKLMAFRISVIVTELFDRKNAAVAAVINRD